MVCVVCVFAALIVHGVCVFVCVFVWLLFLIVHGACVCVFADFYSSGCAFAVFVHGSLYVSIGFYS